MSLTARILNKGLSSFRQFAVLFVFKGLIVIALLVGLDIVYPVTFGLDFGDSQSALSYEAQLFINTVVRIFPVSLLMAMFLVPVHRQILLLDSGDPVSLTMKISRIELNFLAFSLAVAVFIWIPQYLISSAFGDYLSFLDMPIDSYIEYSKYGNQFIGLVVTVLIMSRFALYAPLVVQGVRSPLGRAWKLSGRRIISLTTLVFVYAFAGRILQNIVGMLSGFIEINVLDENVTYSILGWTVHVIVAAFAAMLLSHAYLELTRDDAETASFPTA